MASSFHNDLYDSGLSVITDAASAGTLRLVLCSAVPTTRAEAATLHDGGASKYRLTGEHSLGSGDVTLGDRTGGGREITVSAVADTIMVTLAAGSDLHFALYDTTRLLYVGDETSDQALTNGNPINYPSFKFGFSSVA